MAGGQRVVISEYRCFGPSLGMMVGNQIFIFCFSKLSLISTSLKDEAGRALLTVDPGFSSQDLTTTTEA